MTTLVQFFSLTMFIKFVNQGKLSEIFKIFYRIVEYTEKCFKLLVVNGDQIQYNILKKTYHCVMSNFSHKR